MVLLCWMFRPASIQRAHERGSLGYAKGGYMYINFQEDRNDLRLDTTLEGAFVEAGLIF